MKLYDIAKQLPVVYDARVIGSSNPEIGRVIFDTRTESSQLSGAIFACVKGEHRDGHDMAAKALEIGAIALLCERELDIDVPQLIVRDSRSAMGAVAALVLGSPADRLTMIGVTGTNGKTTTTYLLRSILNAANEKTGLIGSVVWDDGVCDVESIHTTPEGPDLQLLLANMLKNGCGFCVMETSSHGIVQGRMAGCLFDRIAFSNLTPEHLEFHADMESYFQAKKALFSDYTRGDWAGAVNADDAYGERLLADFPDRTLGFTLTGKPGAPYRASITEYDISGMTLALVIEGAAGKSRKMTLKTPLLGEYNAYNVLEAAVLADSLGIPADSIAEGIVSCGRVPGRLERYDLENGVTVFIDFAHSVDAMEKVLSTLAGLVKGKFWVLWGAGGDRTPVKRPLVGDAMARYGDRVIVTTDNPRSENPADIASQVERGLLDCSKPRCVTHEIILDRRDAIYEALDSAEPGDVVLIAGKGPEPYIDYGTHKEPFLDAAVLLDWAGEKGVRVL